MNIDKSEIEFFENIADEWWDRDGKFKPLHQINVLRIGFIKEKLIERFGRIDGLQVLDIGCGGGLLAEEMAKLGAKVVGLDAGEKNIKVAKLHAKRSELDIEYICGTVDNMSEKFDVILNMEVIEHVPNPALFIDQSCELLADGGMMFVSTINRTLLAFGLAIIGAEYILRWLPIGTHQWRKFIKPSELETMLNTNNLKLNQIIGINFNPLKNKWYLSGNTTVNYIITASS